MQDTNITPLKSFLLKNKMSIYKFSKITGIASATLSDLVKGRRKACKRTAIRICQLSNGELSLEDFGYTECSIIAKLGGGSSEEKKSMQEVAGKQISRAGFNIKKKSAFIPIGNMSRKLSGSKELKEDV